MRFAAISALLIPAASAAVQQQCIAFEDPGDSVGVLTVNASSVDTSVLIYHLVDLENTNIPLQVTDYIIQSEPDGFGVCSQKAFDSGYCENLGSFMVETSKAQSNVVNEFVLAGGHAQYRVEKQGVYCYVAYQQGEAVKGVKTIQRHTYGFASLREYEVIKAGFVFIIVQLFIQITAIFVLKKYPSFKATIYEDIVLLFLYGAILQDVQICSLLYRNNRNVSSRFYDVEGDFWQMVYFLISSLIYYKLSIGVFGFGQITEKINIQKAFKVCLFGFVPAKLITINSQTLLKILPFGLSSLLILFSSLFVTFCWIPMFVMIWKNSNKTIKQIMDPIFLRNYKLTRRILLWGPILANLVSFFGVLIVVLNSTKDSLNIDPATGQIVDLSKLTMQMGDAVFRQDYWFVLLKNLPMFSSMITCTVLMFYVWRPKVVNRTEFEEIRSHEMNDEPKGEVRM